MTTTTTSSADAPLVVFPFGEPDPRLEDYLDDKLQSTADLETLDALLAGVSGQHAQLQAQLDDAAQELEAARDGAAAQRRTLQAAVDEFDGLEETIRRRLAVANAEGAAPEAVVQRLTEPMEQLQRVTLAHDYLVLLADVHRLVEAARGALPDRPRDALAPLRRLRLLEPELAARQQQADGAAAHLRAHVAGVADGLWAEMKATMRGEFAALLAQRGWPAAVDAAVRADETWRDGFAKLVDLQAHEILQWAELAQSAQSASKTQRVPDPPPLFPVELMAEISVKEFRYHFLTEGRKTSDPRQIGDVCFPWFLDRVDTWAEFLRDSFADLLAARFAGTAVGGGANNNNENTATTMVYADPACNFVAALLPVLREKLAQTVDYAVRDLQLQREQLQRQQPPGNPATLTGPVFLSSLVVQLLTFDDDLRSRFGYDGGCASPAAWHGLAAPAVLDQHFPLWLQAEKEYALARYREIVEGASQAAQDARSTIDYDYAGAGRTKPTLAAVHVVDLLRAVTAQYRRVRAFGHRLRFLIDIQITLLDEYHDRLRGSLEAYAAMTSTVGRTLHGVTKEQLATLEGTGGLEALCRVYGSADLIINTLREWGDEEFFVLLWDELQTRSKKAEDHSGLVGGGMSAGQVRQRTSAAVGNGGGGNGGDSDDAGGSLFDETIQAFSLRRKTAQEFLVAALADSHRKAFRPYVLRPQWTTVAVARDDLAGEAASDAPDLTAVTAELDEPLRVIRRNLDFLARALGTAALRRVVRGAVEKLQDLLWGEVLAAQSFTAQGAAQFARDVAAVAALVERHVPRGSAAFEGLREGVQLLNLPVASTSESGGITLQQANDRVFKDNPEAKKVLQELGLATLTPATARMILQRRVESSG